MYKPHAVWPNPDKNNKNPALLEQKPRHFNHSSNFNRINVLTLRT